MAAAWLVACSLLVDAEGLSGGPTADGGRTETASPEVDARVDTSPADAARDVDGAIPDESYSAAVLADAPILYLRLEDAPNSVTAKNEVAGPGATVGGSATFGAAGAFAGSTGISFDGTNGGVFAPTYDFSGLRPLSFELWFRPRSYDATYRFPVTALEVSDAGRQSIDIFSITDGFAAERWVANVAIATPPQSPPSVGTYHHLVVTYDGSLLSFFVDSVLAGQAADERPMGATKLALSFGTFSVGMTSVLGSIDELALYDKALAPGRIAAHYKASGR